MPGSTTPVPPVEDDGAPTRTQPFSVLKVAQRVLCYSGRTPGADKGITWPSKCQNLYPSRAAGATTRSRPPLWFWQKKEIARADGRCYKVRRSVTWPRLGPGQQRRRMQGGHPPLLLCAVEVPWKRPTIHPLQGARDYIAGERDVAAGAGRPEGIRSAHRPPLTRLPLRGQGQ